MNNNDYYKQYQALFSNQFSGSKIRHIQLQGTLWCYCNGDKKMWSVFSVVLAEVKEKQEKSRDQASARKLDCGKSAIFLCFLLIVGMLYCVWRRIRVYRPERKWGLVNFMYTSVFCWGLCGECLAWLSVCHFAPFRTRGVACWFSVCAFPVYCFLPIAFRLLPHRPVAC